MPSRTGIGSRSGKSPTPPIKDTLGHIKIGVSAAKISRKTYNFLYNPIMETGGVAVSDEVSIVLGESNSSATNREVRLHRRDTEHAEKYET